MTLQTGSDVGRYTVLRPARRQPRHGRRDEDTQPRVWCAVPFGGGDPVALIGPAGPDAAVTPGDPAPAAADPAAAIRREWALTGSLRHPHLMPALDLVDADTGPVLVTGWADGGSLADRLRSDGRLTAGQTVTLLAGLSQALLACHDRGLVHGDVSPSTVLLSGDGRPLLARVGRRTAAVDSGMPGPAEPRCASPDIARGRAATVVDDVFGMGAVAMQALLGRPAWPAQDLRDVVIQSEFGQWPTIPPDAGAGPTLTALVDAMLDADPSRRPSVREVSMRLAGCPDPEPLTGPVPTPDPAVADDRGGHAGTGPAAVDERDADRNPLRPAGRPAPRWTHVVAGVGALVAVGVLAVAAGIWWAGADRPATATLAAVSDTPAGSPVAETADTARDGGTSVAAPPPTAPVGPTEWAAVVIDLDRQRAAAFAAADPTLLEGVYVRDVPASTQDRERVQQLARSGLRVTGLLHEISAVEVVGSSAAATTVAVTDALPAADIVDASGSTVGSTTATPTTRRLLTLTTVDGQYRIAALAAA